MTTGGRVVTWDPAQYGLFSDHRRRPFGDLLARVGAVAPSVVVDLGCGPGPLTLGLADRWPQARIIGVDSSPHMLEQARAADPAARVEWIEADVASWQPPAGVDVIVTNATLQWVPGHLDLLPRWVDALAPGGWFAMQVPGNFDAPSRALLREVAAGSAAASTCGRRRTCTCWTPKGRRSRRCWSGPRAPPCGRCCRSSPTRVSGRGSWRRTRGGSSRPIRVSRSARSSRSAASSPSPSGPGVRRERAGLGCDRPGPRPGVVPGRVRGPDAGVLRRGARHDREAQAARPRGAR